HTGYFASEPVKLVHHGVDRILEFENFPFHVHRDRARQIATSHSSGHFSDVSHLAGEVSGHGVDGGGDILPGSCHAGHVGLSAQAAFGSDFAGHTRNLTGEAFELTDHGVERL